MSRISCAILDDSSFILFKFPKFISRLVQSFLQAVQLQLGIQITQTSMVSCSHSFISVQENIGNADKTSSVIALMKFVEMAKVGSGYQVGLSWVPLQDHKLPQGAIKVDEDLYVARATLEGEKIPGKYSSKYNLCYVPYGGKEHQVEECEILCDSSIHCDGSWYESHAICLNFMHLQCKHGSIGPSEPYGICIRNRNYPVIFTRFISSI